MSTLQFEYRVMDRQGRETRGTIGAASRDQAFRQLVENGLTPLAIKAAAKSRTRSGRVRTVELAQFTYQLRVLLEARIPIGEGIAGLAQQETNERFRAVLNDIASRVESGQTIASSMGAHKDVFGEVYLATIAAAEQSGTMVKTLDHLSESIERISETSRQVRAALSYPACVMFILAASVTFLVTFTVPKFAAMFEARGVELPILTRVLAGLGESVAGWWWAYLVVMAGVIWGVRWSIRNQRGAIELILHRIPALRTILVSLAVARFSRVLSVSLSAGMGLLESLELARRAGARELLSRDVARLIEQVRTGRRLSDGLPSVRYLPSFARRLYAAGEQSGELVRMTGVVARHFEHEVSHRVKNISTLIEPVLIVMITGVVLVVALAIFLPMWNMIQIMS